MSTSHNTPLRVALIGGGPSGFFLAGLFLKEFEDVEIHLFERETMPYGLVRYGIAPDHQHTKKVTKVFEKIAADPRLHFHGNVEIGKDILLQNLRQSVDLVVVATGHDRARSLGILGEEHSIPALDWVNWYNCHPAHSETTFSWQGDTGVVVGNGNVAMDIVRLLGVAPETLESSDIHPKAIETFKKHPLKRLIILGRRGPAQASFKIPELRELMANDALELAVDSADLELNKASAQELELPENREHQKVLTLLEEIAQRPARPNARCRIEFQFFRSPLSISNEAGSLHLRLSCNVLKGPPSQQSCTPSDEEKILEAGLIVTAVGYLGSEIPGLPFDEQRGRLPTEKHRVIDDEGNPLPGVYASGWIKTGPRGLVGNSRQDANETFKQIKCDLEEGLIPQHNNTASINHLLKTLIKTPVSWSDWQTLNRAEIQEGEKNTTIRKKFQNNSEALAYLHSQENNKCPQDAPDNLTKQL